MSSLTLRTAIYAAWPTLTPGLRYLPVENKDLPTNPPLPLPDVWGTLAFDGTRRRILTMGRNPWVEETGQVTFVVLGRSGHGDIPAVTAATDLMHAWDGWQDITGDCWLQNVGPPSKINLESNGQWFLYGVRADYRVQERVDLP